MAPAYFAIWDLYNDDYVATTQFHLSKHAGGIHGASFTSKEHRNRGLFVTTALGLAAMAQAKNEVILGETTRTLQEPFKECGISHVLVLHKSPNEVTSQANVQL